MRRDAFGELLHDLDLRVVLDQRQVAARYELDRHGRPEFSQLLPAPLGPEGLLSIPHRNLLIASGEVRGAMDESFDARDPRSKTAWDKLSLWTLSILVPALPERGPDNRATASRHSG